MHRPSIVIALALSSMLGCASDGSDAPAPSGAESAPVLEQVRVLPTNDAGAQRRLVEPVRGTWNGTPFTAVLTITRFAVENGAVVALGSLSNVVGDLPPDAIAALTGQLLRLPVALPTSAVGSDAGLRDAGAGCDVLALLLQPLHLDLLGAVVDLDEVDLDVTAVPGAGNLLGNLLCAVAGLLDPDGLLKGLTDSVLGPLVDGLNGLVGGALGPLGAETLDGGAAPGV
ncbi:MAG: hypothetical protein ABW252_23190 [Polyangiales bacterium]